MEREIQNVVDIVKLAKSVNKDALALLKLDEDYTYEPLPRIEDKSVVRTDLCTLMYMAAAADRLGLETTEGIARRAIQYPMYAYNCVTDKCPTMDTHLHGPDLAHNVLNFILDMCQTLDMLKKVEQMEKERKEENSEDNKHGSDTDDSEEENKEKTAKKKKTPASESHHINRKCLVRQCYGY